MTNHNFFNSNAPANLLSQLSPSETAQLLYEFSSCLSHYLPDNQPEPKPQATLSGQIRSLLTSIGVPPHLYGFAYLAEAVRLCMDDPSLMHKLTLKLYPMLAEKMNATAGSVERCIRHCITVAWNRQKPGAVDELLGRNVISCFEKPSNGEMIAALVEYLTRTRD